MSKQPRFHTEQIDDVTVIRLTQPDPRDGRLVRELSDQLTQLVQSTRPEHLLVDFSRVKSYPAAAISALLRARKLLGDPEQLKFCGMCQQVQMAYRFLNLEGTVFDIYPTPAAALDAFEPALAAV